MDDSSSGSGGVGGVDDGGSASASVVAGAGAAAAGNRDQEQDQPSHQQKQHEQQQHLQMRRLSYTTPATPFVGTPAGAPPDPACATSRHCYSGPSDPLGNSGNNGDDDDDDNERKMPANLQHRQQQGQPVAVDSHLHLDDIRHPPLHPHHHHPQPQPQSRPQSAHDSAAAASASASVASHPSPQQQPQQQPHPTPQTRSSALLSAQHCASCALASTPPNLADRAVKSAHAAFKYWWDQDRIAERMVGEGDAEVTGVRVARRGSESSMSASAQSSVTDLGFGGGAATGGAGAGGGTGGGTGGGSVMMMNNNHRQHNHFRHGAAGGGAASAGAAAIRPQESFDEGSVASSMMSKAAAAATAASASGAAAAAAPAPIPMAIAVNNNMTMGNSSPARQRIGGGGINKRGRMHSSSAHGDALWATDTEDEDADGEAGGSSGARKRQKRTPVAGPAPPPPPPPPPHQQQQQQQQQQIPARTEMVRSEMASFLKQQRYRSELQQTKTALLNALQMNGGDVTTEPFLFALKRLRGLYKRSGLDCRRRVVSFSSSTAVDETAGSTPQLEGMWLTLSRPNFHDCLGLNEQREYMYTLGRMSFGMYKPTNIVCSVQGTFNPIHRVDSADVDEVESVPRSLRKEVHEGRTLLRTYNIVTAFSIEPASPLFGDNSPNATVVRPIRCIMTTYGYILPDPSTPNRLSVWFTGGTVEVDDEGDADEWKRIFGGSSAAAAAANAGPMAPPRPGPSLSERAKMLAAKLLLGASVPHGMEEDGSMSFKLKRPVGGHGSTYVDTIYLDDTLRIMQGHHGSLFVMARVPGS